MALIGKIRKNFWFVLILLGLALAAFIIMDMTSAGNRGAQANPMIAKIEGERISYKEFSQSESGLFTGSTTNSYENRKNLWDFYVEKAIIDTEARNLGLGISQSELDELQFGPNYSQMINQQLQSGALTFQQLNEIKNAIDTDQFTNPQFRLYWSELQKQIMKSQKQNKLTNLVGKAVYTPTWMAEENFKQSNTNVDIAYAKIPFDKYSGQVELSDAEIQSYIDSRKSEYVRDVETRVLDYLSFEVVPTPGDSAKLFNDLAAKIEDFKNAENDSLYALNNSGDYSNNYFTADQFPDQSKDAIVDLPVGDVFGPFENRGTYFITKKIDERLVPDSVEAKHILRQVAPGDLAGLAAASAYIDSIKTVYDSGVASFDSLAITNSQDGSASRGGDLGTFVQGAMVPEFNNVCFVTGKEGNEVYKVVSQFGVHLIKIERQVFNNTDNKYKIVNIATSIVPSEATQDSVYDYVAQMLADLESVEELDAFVNSNDALKYETVSNLKSDDFAMGRLPAGNSSRRIVKWAFDPSTEINDVSPDIYDMQHQQLYYDRYYVLGVLRGINPAGVPKASEIKDQIFDLALNEKKGQKLAEQISGSDLNAIASQFGVKVDTASNVNLAANFAPGLGGDTEVLGAAFGLGLNEVSAPVVAPSGVYVVQVVSRKEAPDPFNIPNIRTTDQNATRQIIFANFIEGLKKNADIEDNRSTFY